MDFLPKLVPRPPDEPSIHTGRLNFVEEAVLPSGVWPTWCGLTFLCCSAEGEVFGYQLVNSSRACESIGARRAEVLAGGTVKGELLP